MRSSLAVCVLAILGLGVFWSLRLGYADLLYSKGDPADVALARRMAAGNARYFKKSSEMDSSQVLKQAIALNPYYSIGWIELGLEAELSGNQAEAERLLLAASRVDRSYIPLWTLANFYFRQRRPKEFWLWARRAAAIAPHDQSALFDLCWRMSADPSEILEKAIPRQRQILSQYLNFLLRRGNLEAAAQAAGVLLAVGERSDLPTALACCDRLLEAGSVAEAAALWNSLSERKWIPYPPVSPELSRIITNGDFSVAPINAGFDWRILRTPEVTVYGPSPATGFSLVFSGRQPEDCLLLAQAAPLHGGRVYRLGYGYRTEGIPPASGLKWVVESLSRGGGRLAVSEDLWGEDWREGTLKFGAPPDLKGVRLVLAYRRAAGTTRIEGTLRLRRVWLAPD